MGRFNRPGQGRRRGPVVFISYRRDDAPAHAGRLRDEIVRAGFAREVFMDVDSIAPGTDFGQTIETTLEQTDIFLVIIGPRWTGITDSSGKPRLHEPGDFVRREVEGALAKAGVLVVPVLVGGAHMPQGKDLPESLQRLAHREAFELRDSRWGRDVGDLVSYLGRVSGAGDSGARSWSLRSIVVGAVVSLVLVIGGVVVLQLLGSDDPDADAATDPASSGTSAPPSSPASSPSGSTTAATPIASPAVSAPPSPTAPTEPARPGLRDVFTGINDTVCNDTTLTWPGVEVYDAVQVMGCDFKGYIVDFHQWPSVAEMQRFARDARREYAAETEVSTNWRLETDGEVGGAFYIWSVQGGYELLWTVNDAWLSARMFARVDTADEIQSLWEDRPGVRMQT